MNIGFIYKLKKLHHIYLRLNATETKQKTNKNINRSKLLIRIYCIELKTYTFKYHHNNFTTKNDKNP